MNKTEICNRALALLGHDRTITDYDGKTSGIYNDQSTEAVRCRQFLDSALADCLSEHDWDFAAVDRNLGLVWGDAYGWAKFPVPPDAMRIVSVSTEDGKPLKTRRNRDFLEVQTNGSPCKLRYVSTDIDTTTLPHKFLEAFIARLAFLLCGPMYGDDGKTNNFHSLAARRLSEAIHAETDETAYRGNADNPFIVARR